MRETETYVWDVESSEEAAGHVRVALVRKRERRSSSHLRQHTEVVERTVFFARSFRPLLETVALEHYKAQLELVARYAREGQFGCFVLTQSDEASVQVTLYERTFDGNEVCTEELARQAFDASDEQSLVTSTEFLADLRIWAERQNDAREQAILEAREADDVRARLASEQAAASR
ncbi:MAG TPA: hypothetical protein VME01_11425, partial [Solirubrobacteraceae bacterium]|nr:hypothetical protein [Solirubrobacteraceae bacterium]